MNHHDYSLDIVWTMTQEAEAAGETLLVTEIDPVECTTKAYFPTAQVQNSEVL